MFCNCFSNSVSISITDKFSRLLVLTAPPSVSPTLAQFFRWFWVYPIFKCVVLAFAAITAAILTMNPTDRNAEIEEELKRMNEDDEDLNV